MEKLKMRNANSKFKVTFLFLFVLVCFFSISFKTYAADYVLPYPGLMPGHPLYKIKQIFDQLYRLYVFGSFSSHKYELSLADKKLVEAKILFEYRQYPLALKALSDSNQHWQKAVFYLEKAEDEGKDISQKMVNLRTAAEKHREILENLRKNLPEHFFWQPEKEETEKLTIGQSLNQALKFRHSNYLNN